MVKNRSVRSTLTSQSRFTTDLIPYGALHTFIIRSTVSSGKVSAVRHPETDSTTGVLFTRDIPGSKWISFFDDRIPLLLEDDTVRYLGQPIGIVYSSDLAAARDFLADVEIEYSEVGDGVFDPGPETLFFADELVWDDNPEGEPVETPILAPAVDAAALEDEEDTTSVEQQITSSFSIGSQFQPVQERTIAVAKWQDERLVIHTPTVWPQHLAQSAAETLGLKPSQIDVHATIPGNYHDRLIVDSVVLGCLAGMVTLHTRQASAVSFSHTEESTFATKQAPMTCSHSMTVHPETGIQSMDITYRVNMGAYPVFCREVVNQILGSANLSYRCPRGRVKAEIHRTNLLPMSVFHGFLSGQVQCCMEVQINRLAFLLNLDPLQLRIGLIENPPRYARKRNWEEHPNSLTLIPTINGSADFSRKYASFEMLRGHRGERSEQSTATRYRPMKGIGSAVGFQGNSFSRETEALIKTKIHLRMEKSGTLKLFAATTPGSSAIKSHYRDLITEVFSVDNEQLHIAPATGDIPDAGPMSLSRSLSIARKLILQACRNIQRQRFRNPLPIGITKVFSPPVQGHVPGYPLLQPSWAAAVAEVSVDPVSYLPSVTGIWMTVQAGHILHPGVARAHIEGTVIQTLSWILNQRWELESGILVPRVAVGYSPTGLVRTPSVSIEFLDSDGLPIPERTKSADSPDPPLGIGELAQATIPAAILSALSQATGSSFDQLPITPELIHRYMMEET